MKSVYMFCGTCLKVITTSRKVTLKEVKRIQYVKSLCFRLVVLVKNRKLPQVVPSDFNKLRFDVLRYPPYI